MPITSSYPPQLKISQCRLDWRGWLALAWSVWFGALYVRMVLTERAPGLTLWLDSIARR